MALDRQKLYDGLLEAFEKGKETQSVSGGEEGEVEAKYSKGDVAGFIADAIVSYASDAEVMLLTGPFLIPAAPSPIPDPANMGQKVKVQTAETGKAALKSAIEGSFNSMDPAMSLITAGIMAYIPASFTAFSSTVGNTATGATAPTVPPILAPCTAAGMAGSEEPDIVDLMATIIHTSFMASLFNGVGITVAGGVGPVVAQPLM